MVSSTASFRQVRHPTLNRFIALPENRSALDAVEQLARRLTAAEPRRKPFPPLFLHGPPGSGKSHLASGLVDQVVAGSGRAVQMLAAVDLGRMLIEPPSPGNDLRRDLRNCDLLVVEDVQHFPATAAEALAHLIDHRQARSRCLMATGSAGPAALGHLPNRLTSRLASGLVVGLEPLSAASRRALAEELCRQRRLHVTAEVLDWLAREPSGGARPILGALARLEALSRTVPPPLGLKAIAELPAGPDATQTAIERIARLVAEAFAISPRQMKGKARRRNVLWPRQVGMFLARRLTGLSLVRIGAFFGGRDHSTVLHACQKVEQQRGEDPALATTLRRLEAELGETRRT
jgi:chromosomal replication initiator protein